MQLTEPLLLRSNAYIDGRWEAADSGATLLVIDPATTAKERAALMLPLVRTDPRPRRRPRPLITAECGKPLAEAKGEVGLRRLLRRMVRRGRQAHLWRNHSATGGRQAPDRHQAADRRLRRDHAVEFPARHDHAQGGAGLAAGCTMVVKPAEQTPLTALALAALAHRPGFPPGVFNIVTGDPVAIGGELTASPIVRKLSFTGSTEVGRLLMAQCAPTIKKLSLELGGNAPFIVFDDADLDAAVEGALVAKYRNTGQTCVCANRFLVQESGVHEAFAEKLAARVAAA
jgi:succinate-semialdehyde dehydrogenase/glutarate-semialdehyde dehydrogenase